MKAIKKLKQQLIEEIKEGRTSPSQAAEKFAAATDTAFNAGECYLSYGDGNFGDLAAEWIDNNLDTDSDSDIEDLFAYCQPHRSLLLRQQLMANNICDPMSLIAVLMNAGIEMPYDDLVIAIADAGLAEEVIAAVTAEDDD